MAVSGFLRCTISGPSIDYNYNMAATATWPKLHSGQVKAQSNNKWDHIGRHDRLAYNIVTTDMTLIIYNNIIVSGSGSKCN